MKVDLIHNKILIDSFESDKEAVHYYIEHLFDRTTEKLGAGVVMREDRTFYRIRSQFDGHRKPNCYMVATKFGGVVFDYFTPTPEELKTMQTNHVDQTQNSEAPVMTTKKAITSFQSASKRMVADVRADLKALDKAETQAHTSAMKAVDALPEVNRTLMSMAQYVTRGHGKQKVIVDGPFTLRSTANTALRDYCRKNPTVNPLTIAVALGSTLRATGVKFAPDCVHRRGVKERIRTTARTSRVNPERVKAQQELMRKRRQLARANSAVMRATHPLYSKLYVADDKSNRMLSGPYSTHAAAVAALTEHWKVKDLIVLSGQQCAHTRMQYAPKFVATAPVKLSATFFAEGQSVLVGGKISKITAVPTKKSDAKTITVAGVEYHHDDFSINYSRCMLMLTVK